MLVWVTAECERVEKRGGLDFSVSGRVYCYVHTSMCALCACVCVRVYSVCVCMLMHLQW